MTEAKIDARNAQGLVNRPEGEVNQQFGDRTTTNTDGGDAAGGNIDKSSTTVININMAGSDAMPQAAQAQLISSLDPSGALDQQQVQMALQAALPKEAALHAPIATEPSSIVAQLQDFNRLREFLCALLRDVKTPDSIRPKLVEALQALGVSEEEIQANQAQPLQSKNQASNPYLMVVVQPIPAKADQILVKAWLLPDGADTELSQFEPLDLEAEQKGITCLMTEAPNVVDRFIKQSKERLLSRIYDNITIELFLPLEYLSVDLDEWQVSRRRKLLSLRQQHPILIRSYERLEREYLVDCLPDWRKTWSRIQACLGQVPQQDNFEQLDLESCDWDLIPDKFLSQNQKIGFVIPCLPGAEEQEDLFNALIDASAPVTLWFRDSPPGLDQMGELKKLLAGGSLADLPERLRAARHKASSDGRSREEHFSYHLSILWEDPNRLTPDVMIQLQAPG